MKIIVPVKEYAKFIKCNVYNKDVFGELKFLYNETYNKEMINIETLKKLLRYDNTLKYIDNKLDVLTTLNADKELIKVLKDVRDKLTRDEVV